MKKIFLLLFFAFFLVLPLIMAKPFNIGLDCSTITSPDKCKDYFISSLESGRGVVYKFCDSNRNMADEVCKQVKIDGECSMVNGAGELNTEQKKIFCNSFYFQNSSGKFNCKWSNGNCVVGGSCKNACVVSTRECEFCNLEEIETLPQLSSSFEERKQGCSVDKCLKCQNGKCENYFMLESSNIGRECLPYVAYYSGAGARYGSSGIAASCNPSGRSFCLNQQDEFGERCSDGEDNDCILPVIDSFDYSPKSTFTIHDIKISTLVSYLGYLSSVSGQSKEIIVEYSVEAADGNKNLPMPCFHKSSNQFSCPLAIAASETRIGDRMKLKAKACKIKGNEKMCGKEEELNIDIEFCEGCEECCSKDWQASCNIALNDEKILKSIRDAENSCSTLFSLKYPRGESEKQIEEKRNQRVHIVLGQGKRYEGCVVEKLLTKDTCEVLRKIAPLTQSQANLEDYMTLKPEFNEFSLRKKAELRNVRKETDAGKFLDKGVNTIKSLGNECKVTVSSGSMKVKFGLYKYKIPSEETFYIPAKGLQVEGKLGKYTKFKGRVTKEKEGAGCFFEVSFKF